MNTVAVRHEPEYALLGINVKNIGALANFINHNKFSHVSSVIQSLPNYFNMSPYFSTVVVDELLARGILRSSKNGDGRILTCHSNTNSGWDSPTPISLQTLIHFMSLVRRSPENTVPSVVDLSSIRLIDGGRASFDDNQFGLSASALDWIDEIKKEYSVDADGKKIEVDGRDRCIMFVGEPENCLGVVLDREIYEDEDPYYEVTVSDVYYEGKGHLKVSQMADVISAIEFFDLTKILRAYKKIDFKSLVFDVEVDLGPDADHSLVQDFSAELGERMEIVASSLQSEKAKLIDFYYPTEQSNSHQISSI